MLPLPAARTYEEGFPLEIGISRFWDSAVPVSGRIGEDTFFPPPPSMGQGNKYHLQGAVLAPTTSQTGHIGQGQSIGRGQPQDLQAKSSGQAG